MIKPAALASAVIVVCLALTGCANKEKQLEGKWKYKSADLGAKSPANIAGMMDKILSGMSLDLQPDEKFVLTQPMGKDAIDGTWTLADNVVTLTPKSVGGKPLDESLKSLPAAQQQAAKTALQSMPGTVSDDSKTIVVKFSAAGQSISITFEKEATS